jgi:hypothetical protein
MSIIEEIAASLKGFSKVQKIQGEGANKAAMSIIEGAEVKVVEKQIDGVLEKYLSGGEKIISKIKEGEIIDGGEAFFKILGGYVIEFYDYETQMSVFIRNYLISDARKEWIAVYVDQNASSPWWNRD